MQRIHLRILCGIAHHQQGDRQQIVRQFKLGLDGFGVKIHHPCAAHAALMRFQHHVRGHDACIHPAAVRAVVPALPCLVQVAANQHAQRRVKVAFGASAHFGQRLFRADDVHMLWLIVAGGGGQLTGAQDAVDILLRHRPVGKPAYGIAFFGKGQKIGHGLLSFLGLLTPALTADFTEADSCRWGFSPTWFAAPFTDCSALRLYMGRLYHLRLRSVNTCPNDIESAKTFQVCTS